MADTTTFSDFSLSSGVMSAPTDPSAVKTAPGSVNNSANNSAGLDSNTIAAASSSVSTTPLSSVTIGSLTMGVIGAVSGRDVGSGSTEG